MKLPFVSRNKFEIMLNNFKLSEQKRASLSDETVEYQTRIKELKEELETLVKENEKLRREKATLKAKVTKLNKKVEE